MSTTNARSTTTHTTRSRLAALVALLAVLALVGCDDNPLDAEDTSIVEGNTSSAESTEAAAARGRSFPVSGTIITDLSIQVVHSQVPTENGFFRRVSNTQRYTGDLDGYVSSSQTVEANLAELTAVVRTTGHFSGTVAGSAPVMLYNDDTMLDVDLATGTLSGVQSFRRSRDARARDGWFVCNLRIVTIGETPEGADIDEYTGECTPRGRVFDVDHDDDVSSDPVM